MGDDDDSDLWNQFDAHMTEGGWAGQAYPKFWSARVVVKGTRGSRGLVVVCRART